MEEYVKYSPRQPVADLTFLASCYRGEESGQNYICAAIDLDGRGEVIGGAMAARQIRDDWSEDECIAAAFKQCLMHGARPLVCVVLWGVADSVAAELLKVPAIEALRFLAEPEDGGWLDEHFVGDGATFITVPYDWMKKHFAAAC